MERREKTMDIGLRSDWKGGWEPKEQKYKNMSFEKWTGECPEEKDYMPDWFEEEKTHFQMYEDTTEGTPISPIMPDPESLAHWLADNKASAFGDMTATYEQWLNTIKKGWAVGAILDKNGFKSGVEFIGG